MTVGTSGVLHITLCAGIYCAVKLAFLCDCKCLFASMNVCKRDSREVSHGFWGDRLSTSHYRTAWLVVICDFGRGSAFRFNRFLLASFVMSSETFQRLFSSDSGEITKWEINENREHKRHCLVFEGKSVSEQMREERKIHQGQTDGRCFLDWWCVTLQR